MLFLLVFNSCTQIEMIQKFKSGEPVFGRDISIIPIKLMEHKILVSVKLNESKKDFNFLLDTGALTFVSQKTANELNLKKGAEMPTMKKAEYAYLTKLDSITLGEMQIKNFVIPIMDIQTVFDSSLTVDGFIGSDFLRFFNTTIDYENKQVILKQNRIKQDIDEGEYKVELEVPFPLRFPTVNLKINNLVEIDGIIDTGSPFSLVLPLSFIEKFDHSTQKQLIKSKGAIAKWPSTTSDYNYLLRIQNLKLGEFEITNFPILFAELPKQFNTALIGKSFLDQFLLTINYPEKEMILDPRENCNFETNVFSTGLALRKSEDNKTYVKGFWEGSPADKNSIQVNDEIVKINNKNTSELSIREINSLLENDQIRSIELSLIENNKFREVDLIKAMLFPKTE